MAYTSRKSYGRGCVKKCYSPYVNGAVHVWTVTEEHFPFSDCNTTLVSASNCSAFEQPHGL
jgi:hypothetical protein